MNDLITNPCNECPENQVCDSEYTDFEAYSYCPHNQRNATIQRIIDFNSKGFIERPKKSWRDERFDDVVSVPSLLRSYEKDYGTIRNYLKPFSLEELMHIEKVHVFLTNYATRVEITLSCAFYLQDLAKRDDTEWLVEPTSAGRIKLTHYNKWLIDRY